MLVKLDSPAYIDRPAKARIRIGNHRKVSVLCHNLADLGKFGRRHDRQVGHSNGGAGRAATSHVQEVETNTGSDLGGQAINNTRADKALLWLGRQLSNQFA